MDGILLSYLLFYPLPEKWAQSEIRGSEKSLLSITKARDIYEYNQ